jgi:hypothetical protein
MSNSETNAWRPAFLAYTLASVLGCSGAWAESPDTVWTRTYGGVNSGGTAILQGTDGGFLISGYTPMPGFSNQIYLLRLTLQGDTIWSRTFGGLSKDRGNGVTETSDGGYAVVGCLGC